ncbi:F1F0 ATP synthase subunit e, mitochondrial [Dispira parvispora]|uniref:ATP synthase F(0) complex subunit e, mitochondrial n=1 Tax=Dispira parvispora TaxID=1520584 RepID=A0A9W8ASZ5_9FUNG|nr:F1F0 ATP synthase subunit e, mitochondrial [Dispira parvispora]
MASPLVKYLRWGALGAGVLYGYTHYNSLLQRADQNKKQEEYDRYERLIAKAKQEYAQLKGAQSSSGVVTDPDSPQFDLEKYLLSLESPKA